jgi:very-short-patch-repair endonuclease
VPPLPHRPPPLSGAVFRGSVVIRDGLLTRHQLHSRAWRRLFADVYADAALPVTHALRARAVLNHLVPGAVATGRTAAVLWGVDLAGPDDDVECVLPAGSRARSMAGTRPTRRRLSRDEVVRRQGLLTTSGVRTALDLARTRPLDDAVIAVDRFLQPGTALLDDVRAAASVLTGRDCRHVREVVGLADGLAGSPQETRLRLLLRRSGLPAPVAQYVIRRDGRFVARVDMAWPELRLALEYDGAWHGEPGQFARDRARLNRLTEAGWVVVFVTAGDLHRPGEVVTRIRSALMSRSAMSR